MAYDVRCRMIVEVFDDANLVSFRVFRVDETNYFLNLRTYYHGRPQEFLQGGENFCWGANVSSTYFDQHQQSTTQ